MYMKKIRGLGVLFLFIVLVGGFFYQTILYKKIPVPSDTLVGLYHPWRDTYTASYPRGIPFKNFLITDPIRQQIPWRKVVVDSWKKGSVPSLNPYAFAGVPLDANIQAAPFYPFNVLFMLLDFPTAWTILIILQPFLAGIWMYLYLRRVSLSTLSASLGAIAWAFGGFCVSWMTWGTIVHAALWLPLMLLAIDELTTEPKKWPQYMKWGACLLLGIVMTILAGHIQVAAYSLLLSLMYFAYKVTNRSLWVSMGWVMAAGILALLITAAQWLPLLRFVADSGRVTALDTWKNAGWFLPWQHTLQFIAPDFFGNPATLNYWGVWNYGEFIGYIGVIPLIFALSAVSIAGIPRFFGIVAMISFVLMTSNPISVLPYMFHVPVLAVLQPTRLMVLLDFSLAVLAAFGFQQYVKGKIKALHISTIVYGIGLMCLWGVVLGNRVFIQDASLVEHLIVAKRNLIIPTLVFAGFVVWLTLLRNIGQIVLKRMFFVVLIFVCIFDLFRFGWKYTPFTPIAYFFPETPVIQYLQKMPKPFRVMSLDDRILPPNVSAYYGIESIEGYDPIAPALYETYLGASERGNADVFGSSGFNRIYTAHNIDSKLIPYMNVKYVLSLTDVKRPFLKEVMREGETRVYEYTNTLPRVYLADTIERVYSFDDELRALFAKPIGSRIGVSDGSVAIVNTSLSGDEAVNMHVYASNSMKMRVHVANDRLLVVLNRYDGRWSASIDGVSGAKIIRVNYLFMGIVVPSGSHDIILSYQ